WLAGGGLPAQRNVEVQQVPADSPRRKGIRRAGKLMFFSGVLFVVFLAISLAVDEGGPMIVPVLVFFVSLVMMLYARLFSDKTAPVINQAAVNSAPTRSSLPPATSIPINSRPQVRTNELAQPPSVTDHTTKLLDNE